MIILRDIIEIKGKMGITLTEMHLKSLLTQSSLTRTKQKLHKLITDFGGK